ncbi:TM2 domain-containing protein [Enterococcus dispar]|uniref:TM2 domain-containing protein n=1 Tax=Enterococcus dispar ATCC 51266 TaxID=1139219 RepID=S0KUA6_9ENTE|nr:NINE protein [Enterococcus dispar]EOT42786.1 hypothetical protein OMK_01147 [Enterococcus dispar ATCC 51266]EOW84763.1 hypothetical protein I569_00052 [Enterococcus dispar ATCC 51266]MDT2705722.1 TM2 domain-containing protein [Enterococcus dispar]OJG37037.1 hypothetical protein RV01_GL001581 [Enterococcus dispar]
MKMGIRKPSVKKSLKARTTGKAKRAVKKAVVPGYGKKGTGWVKDPKKAAYNKLYSKTTVGVNPLPGSSKSNSFSNSSASYSDSAIATHYVPILVNKFVFAFLAIFLGVFGAQWVYAKQYRRALLYFLFCWTIIPIFMSIYQGFRALIARTDNSYKIYV